MYSILNFVTLWNHWEERDWVRFLFVSFLFSSSLVFVSLVIFNGGEESFQDLFLSLFVGAVYSIMIHTLNVSRASKLLRNEKKWVEKLCNGLNRNEKIAIIFIGYDGKKNCRHAFFREIREDDRNYKKTRWVVHVYHDQDPCGLWRDDYVGLDIIEINVL